MHPLQTLKITLLKVVIYFCTKITSCFLQLHGNQEKIKRVIKSTLAAETIALEQVLEACSNHLFVQMIKSFICKIMNRQVSEEFCL